MSPYKLNDRKVHKSAEKTFRGDRYFTMPQRQISDLLFKDGHYEINITESDLYDLIYSPLYFVLLQNAFQKGSEICVSPNQGNYTDV